MRKTTQAEARGTSQERLSPPKLASHIQLKSPGLALGLSMGRGTRKLLLSRPLLAPPNTAGRENHPRGCLPSLQTSLLYLFNPMLPAVLSLSHRVLLGTGLGGKRWRQLPQDCSQHPTWDIFSHFALISSYLPHVSLYPHKLLAVPVPRRSEAIHKSKQKPVSPASWKEALLSSGPQAKPQGYCWAPPSSLELKSSSLRAG